MPFMGGCLKCGSARPRQRKATSEGVWIKSKITSQNGPEAKRRPSARMVLSWVADEVPSEVLRRRGLRRCTAVLGRNVEVLMMGDHHNFDGGGA